MSTRTTKKSTKLTRRPGSRQDPGPTAVALKQEGLTSHGSNEQKTAVYTRRTVQYAGLKCNMQNQELDRGKAGHVTE